jgi:hypothetical protein
MKKHRVLRVSLVSRSFDRGGIFEFATQMQHSKN